MKDLTTESGCLSEHPAELQAQIHGAGVMQRERIIGTMVPGHYAWLHTCYNFMNTYTLQFHGYVYMDVHFREGYRQRTIVSVRYHVNRVCNN